MNKSDISECFCCNVNKGSIPSLGRRRKGHVTCASTWRHQCPINNQTCKPPEAAGFMGTIPSRCLQSWSQRSASPSHPLTFQSSSSSTRPVHALLSLSGQLVKHAEQLGRRPDLHRLTALLAINLLRAARPWR